MTMQDLRKETLAKLTEAVDSALRFAENAPGRGDFLAFEADLRFRFDKTSFHCHVVPDGGSAEVISLRQGRISPDHFSSCLAWFEKQEKKVDRILVSPTLWASMRSYHAFQPLIDPELHRAANDAGRMGFLWGNPIYRDAEVPEHLLIVQSTVDEGQTIVASFNWRKQPSEPESVKVHDRRGLTGKLMSDAFAEVEKLDFRVDRVVVSDKANLCRLEDHLMEDKRKLTFSLFNAEVSLSPDLPVNRFILVAEDKAFLFEEEKGQLKVHGEVASVTVL